MVKIYVYKLCGKYAAIPYYNYQFLTDYGIWEEMRNHIS
jgi:hypothetical protein